VGEESSAGRAEAVDVVVVGADVHLAARHRWRQADGAVGGERPADLAVTSVESVHRVVGRGAEVDEAPGGGDMEGVVEPHARQFQVLLDRYRLRVAPRVRRRKRGHEDPIF